MLLFYKDHSFPHSARFDLISDTLRRSSFKLLEIVNLWTELSREGRDGTNNSGNSENNSGNNSGNNSAVGWT